MPKGKIGWGTAATRTLGWDVESIPRIWLISADKLKGGRNLLASEVHQVNSSSSDLSFELSITGLPHLDRMSDLLRPDGLIKIGTLERSIPLALKVEILRQKGDLQDALQVVEDYLTELSDGKSKAYYYFTRGRILVESGRQTDALRAFDQALKLVPRGSPEYLRYARPRAELAAELEAA